MYPMSMRYEIISEESETKCWPDAGIWNDASPLGAWTSPVVTHSTSLQTCAFWMALHFLLVNCGILGIDSTLCLVFSEADLETGI